MHEATGANVSLRVRTRSEGGSAVAGLTVLGIFCGSALWWFILSSIVNVIRSKFTPRIMRLVNYLSGAILLAFALYALVTLISF